MTLKAMLMLCGRCNLQAAWGAFALQSPSLVVTMTSIWACHLLSLSSCGPKSPDSETQTLRPGSRIRNPDPEGIKNTTFRTNGRVNQGHMLSFLKHQAAKLWRNSIDPKATMTSPHLWASAGGLWLWLPSWAQCISMLHRCLQGLDTLWHCAYPQLDLRDTTQILPEVSCFFWGNTCAKGRDTSQYGMQYLSMPAWLGWLPGCSL